MKLIVGLGNPGPQYQFSPHNLGFAVIEVLAQRHSVSLSQRRAASLCGRFQLGGEAVWLIEPQTYMNLSGRSVRQWLELEQCGPDSLIVLADDLDLPQGSIRIRQRGSSGGHHGLESIMEAVGTKDFARVRVGVDPGHPLEDPTRYLLRPLSQESRKRMAPVVEIAADAVEMMVREGAERAMNQFNRRNSAPEAQAPSAAAGPGKQD